MHAVHVFRKAHYAPKIFAHATYEALSLLRKPKRPHWTPYMNLAREDRLLSWRRFTSKSQWDTPAMSQATGS